MKTPIKFKFVDFRGIVKHKVIEIEHPDFEDRMITDILGQELMEPVFVPKEKDIVSFVDEIDKREIMDKHEMFAILDYWVHLKKQKEPFHEFLQRHVSNKELLIELLHIATIIKDDIKTLSNEKKLSTLLSHFNVSAKAAITAYQSISKTLKTDLKSIKNEASIDNPPSKR